MADEQSAASTTGEPSKASGGAQALLDAHKDASSSGKGARGPRGPYRKTRDRQAQPEAPKPGAVVPQLPPSHTLPQVMSSATGLFFGVHAALLDDEDWLVTDTVKKEMGDVLSWMLADDFYKVGGLGKYVVGSVMFLSLYSLKAVETAKNRRAKLAASGKGPLPRPGDARIPASGPRPPAPPQGMIPGLPIPPAASTTAVPPPPAPAPATPAPAPAPGVMPGVDLTPKPGEVQLTAPPPGFGVPEAPPQPGGPTA